MSDYIPNPDDQFDTYVVEKFAPYAATNATALGLSSAQTAALAAKAQAWGYSWTGFNNAESALVSATQDKDAKRKDLEDEIRAIATTVQANPAVTDAQKAALGVTVRKGTKTPVSVPTTAPSFQRIDTSTRAILRLFIVDASTPDSRAKPAGVQGCEIREQIGGTAPTEPSAMAFLAIETRMPYRADFDAADVGKTVWFALRWLNTRLEPGPWSPILPAVIPG